MRVAIIMGSTSDLGKVEPAVGILKNYGVEVSVRCLSAHRAHRALSEFVEDDTEILDPYGMALNNYGECFEKISMLINKLTDKLNSCAEGEC